MRTDEPLPEGEREGGPNPEGEFEQAGADPIEQEREARRAAEARADSALRTAETLASAALRTPGPAAPAAAAPVTDEEMPDPVARPREFQEWLKRRDERARHDAIRAVEPIRMEITERQRRSDLWNEFRDTYPQYATLTDVVRTAFLMETGGTGSLPDDTQDLMRRVAGRIEGMRKQLGGNADQRPDPRKQIQNRTAGVLGGSRGSDATTSRRGEGDGKPKTLTDSFKEWQSAVPFF